MILMLISNNNNCKWLQLWAVNAYTKGVIMAVKGTVENLEHVSEGLKEYYTKTDNGFVFDIEGMKPQIEFDKVHKALNKEREINRELAKKNKAYGDHTPETIQGLLTELSDNKLKGEDNSEDAIKIRLEEAMAIRMKPFEKKEAEFVTKEQEYIKVIDAFKAEKLEARLVSDVHKIVTEKDGKYRPEYEDDICNAARVDKLAYSTDVEKFVDTKGNALPEWLANRSKNKLWERSSKGANASGGGNHSGNGEMTMLDIIKNAN